MVRLETTARSSFTLSSRPSSGSVGRVWREHQLQGTWSRAEGHSCSSPCAGSPAALEQGPGQGDSPSTYWLRCRGRFVLGKCTPTSGGLITICKRRQTHCAQFCVLQGAQPELTHTPVLPTEHREEPGCLQEGQQPGCKVWPPPSPCLPQGNNQGIHREWHGGGTGMSSPVHIPSTGWKDPHPCKGTPARSQRVPAHLSPTQLSGRCPRRSSRRGRGCETPACGRRGSRHGEGSASPVSASPASVEPGSRPCFLTGHRHPLERRERVAGVQLVTDLHQPSKLGGGLEVRPWRATRV